MEMNSNKESIIIPRIRVCVRKRPPNKKEIQNGDIDIIDITHRHSLCVKELKNKVDLTKYIEEHQFTFDNVFDEASTNQQIYLDIVRPMIAAAFNKTKVSCFAYGQTGSGKTHTMIGDPTAKDFKCPGLYLMSSYDVFSYLQKKEYSHLEIWCSFYEIYCNKLYDLLNEKNILLPREDGKGNICIVGLIEKQIINIKNLINIIDFGLKSRTTGITGANSDSSRSHAILQIAIKEPNGDPYGKISFIDLAGSERAVDTIDTNRQTKIDGAEINKSLLALKECIRAMDLGKIHKPFRGSKLTLVLRDSFIGNCLTLMIANISPCLSCSEHTLNTLRYADRVKELRRDRDTSNSNNLIINSNNDKDKDKDQCSILSHMLMMPRQHDKTVKYEFTVKKQKSFTNANSILNSNNNNNNNNQKEYNNSNSSNKVRPKEAIHINQLIERKEGDFKNVKIEKASKAQSVLVNFQSNTNENYSNNDQSNLQYNFTPKQYNNNNESQTQSVSHGFKKKEMKNKNQIVPHSPRTPSYVNRNNNIDSNSNNNLSNEEKEYESQYGNIKITSDEDYQKYSNEHEHLIDQILKEEDSFITSHKTHIDDMVDSIKQEMSLIHDVNQPGSDIETYTKGLNKMLLVQVNRINAFRKRLETFQCMLKDEEVLSSKFDDPNDLIEMYDNKVPNEEINLIELYEEEKSLKEPKNSSNH